MSGHISQDQLAALRRLIAASHPSLSRRPREPRYSDDQVKKYRLGEQEKIERGKLPALEQIFDRYQRSLRTLLARQLEMDCPVTYCALDTGKFGSFIKSLPLPANMHLFSLRPLPSSGLLFFSTPLVYAFIEALFGGGGRGMPPKGGREFSSIENRLMAKLVGAMLDELQAAWEPAHKVEIRYSGLEQNPLAVQIAMPSEDAIVARYAVAVGKTVGEMCVCLPAAMLESIRDKLKSGLQRTEPAFAPASALVESHLRRASVELGVELGSGKIKVGDFLSLKPGDLIRLDTPPDAPATLVIEGRPKFTGHVGRHGGQKAFRVQGAVSDRKR